MGHWSGDEIFAAIILNTALVISSCCTGYYYAKESLNASIWGAAITGFLYMCILWVLINR